MLKWSRNRTYKTFWSANGSLKSLAEFEKTTSFSNSELAPDLPFELQTQIPNSNTNQSKNNPLTFTKGIKSKSTYSPQQAQWEQQPDQKNSKSALLLQLAQPKKQNWVKIQLLFTKLEVLEASRKAHRFENGVHKSSPEITELKLKRKRFRERERERERGDARGPYEREMEENRHGKGGSMKEYIYVQLVKDITAALCNNNPNLEK